MSETTTDRAPWCPRCGKDMVRLVSATSHDDNGDLYSRAGYRVGCDDCGFGDVPAWPIQPMKRGAESIARRLIRAELARQALEMRAHSEHFMDDDGIERPALIASMEVVMRDYNGLGAHPLRLPGERSQGASPPPPVCSPRHARS